MYSHNTYIEILKLIRPTAILDDNVHKELNKLMKKFLINFFPSIDCYDRKNIHKILKQNKAFGLIISESITAGKQAMKKYKLNEQHLTLPIIRNYNGQKVTKSGAIYLTGVLEYLIAELLQLSWLIAKGNKIKTRHLKKAIMGDDEFKLLFE